MTIRLILATIAALSLSACAATRDLTAPVEPLGDFRLGFTVVVPSPNYTKAPVSRTAEAEEWKEPLKAAFEERFKRFEGDSFYHLGVIVEGYALAPPGIPVVLSPKSVLIFSLTVVEDATETQLNPDPHQMTVLEEFSVTSVIGSGLLMSKEAQIEGLAEAAARAAEKYLRTKEVDWFAPKDRGEDDG